MKNDDICTKITISLMNYYFISIRAKKAYTLGYEMN